MHVELNAPVAWISEREQSDSSAENILLALKDVTCSGELPCVIEGWPWKSRNTDTSTRWGTVVALKCAGTPDLGTGDLVVGAFHIQHRDAFALP